MVLHEIIEELGGEGDRNKKFSRCSVDEFLTAKDGSPSHNKQAFLCTTMVVSRSSPGMPVFNLSLTPV